MSVVISQPQGRPKGLHKAAGPPWSRHNSKGLLQPEDCPVIAEVREQVLIGCVGH
jgi:hypothetical protein